jgi:hypothetical protein
MTANNNLLLNAAIAGFLAGSTSGRSPVTVTPNDLAGQQTALVTAATAFATSLDGLIPNDGTISGPGGVTLLPSTPAIANAQTSKSGLLQTLCAGALSGRVGTDPVAADYLPLTTQIASLYTQAAATLITG